MGRRVALGIAAFLMCSLAAVSADVPSNIPPAELVRKAINNEMKSSNDRAKFMFRDVKETPKGSETKLLVETKDATAGLLVAINGKPLTPEQKQAEESRLQYLATHPDALAKKKKHEKQDEENTDKILRALPDAFIYQYDGVEKGRLGVGKEGDELVRLKFHPNPNYDPPSHTEQVLTGMQGTILIDANKERLAMIDGTLFREVGFGWGILGHLDKGGHFLVVQGDVGENHWEISKMTLDLTGKILMFKSLVMKSSEVFSDFKPAPPNLTFAQAVELLKKNGSEVAENQPQVAVPQKK